MTAVRRRISTCWAVTDGKVGMEVQCLALAEALGLSPEVRRIRLRSPWRWLPPVLWRDPLRAVDSRNGDSLQRPWPDLVIASGRLSVAPALAIRRASRGRSLAIQIQNPGVPVDRFDVVVTPEHDRLTGANVIASRGALTRVTPQWLAAAAARHGARLSPLPQPRIAVLVGGPNRSYGFPLERAQALADELAAAAEASGGSLLVTTSRRTPAEVAAVLRQRLSGLAGEFWDGNGDNPYGDNPYDGYLALADCFVATCDSVNMICEAAGTGRPVHIAPLVGGSEKFRRFHDSFEAAGITRAFTGRLETWRYTPLAETTRVAAVVRDRLGLA